MTEHEQRRSIKKEDEVRVRVRVIIFRSGDSFMIKIFRRECPL